LTDMNPAVSRSSKLLLALLALVPAGAGAQEHALDPVRGFIAGNGAWTQVAGEATWLVGGRLGLILEDHIMLGGAGMLMVESVDVAGLSAETSFDLEMGYAGLLAGFTFGITDRFSGSLAATIGGGNARVYVPIPKAELGSRNFFLLEPEISVRATLYRQLLAGITLGYRLTQGVSDLPGVAPDDLEGMSLGILLQLGG
jgi:hypothetical protein